MSWYLAAAPKTYRSQIDIKFPNRNKSWDGTIGDAEHSSRSSDHNPDSDGSVNALDITHDPIKGVDCSQLARETAELMKTDSRIEYVIWNWRMISRQRPVWRAYTGKNGHTKHCHISFTHGPGERDGSPFNLPMLGGAPGVTVVQKVANSEYPTLRQGSKGDKVKLWQQLMGAKVDGEFGPATKAATVKWQAENHLKADGVVGNATWGLALQKIAAWTNSEKAKDLDTKKYPALKKGSKGEQVKLWQKIVGVKADGDFGAKTDDATKKWQAGQHLKPTGVTDPVSWTIALDVLGRFLEAVAKQDQAKKSFDARAKAAGYTAAKYPNLKEGSKGKSVELWQQLSGAKADGIFGPATKLYTIKLQRDNKLKDDGVVNRETWVVALELLAKYLKG